MTFFTIFLIALGLAMDCFAVALSAGVTVKKIKPNLMFKISILFGLFQGGMLFLGFLLGSGFRYFIQNIDHWIALILLVFIGGKMIYESFNSKDDKKIDFTSNKILLLLAIATSIDALAVGIGLAFLSTSLFWPTVIVGLMSFLLALIGVLVGKKVGGKLGSKAELLGGLVLVFIGLKIFIEHTFK